MITAALEEWNLKEVDLLLIETVGNLVCPASYDLGEAMRVVLPSATEGEDKPLKYPTIFNTADVAVITKMDIADACDFDLQAARNSIHSVRPGMRILEVSSMTGQGISAAVELLESRIPENRLAQRA